MVGRLVNEGTKGHGMRTIFGIAFGATVFGAAINAAAALVAPEWAGFAYGAAAGLLGEWWWRSFK